MNEEHHGGIAEVRWMVAAWAGNFEGSESEFHAMLAERWVDADGTAVLQEFGDAIGVGRYIPGLQVAKFQEERVPVEVLLADVDFADEIAVPMRPRVQAMGIEAANACVLLYDYVVWPHTDRYRGMTFLGNVPRPAAAGFTSW